MPDKFELVQIRNGKRRKIAELDEHERNEWRAHATYAGDLSAPVFDLNNQEAVKYLADIFSEYLEDVRS